MNIILDAMGGDNAPLAPLQGAAMAVQEYGVQVIAVGDTEILKQTAQQHNIPLDGITLMHASQTIGMDEDATDLLKKKSDSSMTVALKALAEGKGEAFVSAGSSGALLVGATMLVKRIKGIKRAALAPVMPGLQKPWILIDCGANVEVRPEMLVQFAAMGSAYMERVMGVKSPSVGLANNGVEETKGTPLQLAAYEMLKDSGLNFSGNIEAREIPTGVCDVVVCDGFTGNIILKLTEGVAKFFSAKLKEMFYKNAKTKMAALMLKSDMAELKKSFDYTEYGGAPLLGIRKPVIKGHGSSDAKAVKNAIRQARTCAENNVAGCIEEWLAQNKQREQENADE